MGMYLTSFWGASEVGPGLGIRCPYPTPLHVREKYIGKPIEGTEAPYRRHSHRRKGPGWGDRRTDPQGLACPQRILEESGGNQKTDR